MIHFKACPRCKGDMLVADDVYGQYLECLQCGHEQELEQDSRAKSIWNPKAGGRQSGTRAA